MQKSYNLIKAWNNSIFHELKGSYKKLNENVHSPIFSKSQKVDEVDRYGEKVWINEQFNNYVESLRLSKLEFFDGSSIDSGIFNSSASNTYCKSSTSLNRKNNLVNFFQSIWKSEEKINNIVESHSMKYSN